jgi:ATPase subunit of ABC transporter with duplicated ATPase domains
LATQIWAAQPGELNVFKGNYHEYAEERTRREQAAREGAQSGSGKSAQKGNGRERPAHGLNPFQLAKRLEAVEARIHALEAKLEQLQADISTASVAGEARRVSALGVEYTQTEADLQAAMAEWETLAE